ncbi:unnamed protein product [Sphenostylis stenocarpa]|uniref:Protein kinase domain-containing protein n=1 Tax=Sphenostylis stenocarpa TaxID=92480 RepID=A0AA86SK80_9FABA|nr:unnamed protein product [Sphenostylis stenocarpa]
MSYNEAKVDKAIVFRLDDLEKATYHFNMNRVFGRDIKSTNVPLDEKYRAKIADFGASRVISTEATHLTTVFKDDNLSDIIDKRVVKEAEKGQIIAVANLAKRCLRVNGKKRPTTKEITFELARIHRLVRKSNAEKNGEENELALQDKDD